LSSAFDRWFNRGEQADIHRAATDDVTRVGTKHVFLWLFVVCLRFPVQRVKEHIKQGWSSLM